MKYMHDIRSIIGATSNRKQFICPIPGHIHHNNTPSFSIFVGKNGEERWICFNPSCPSNAGPVKGGDAIDLIGYLRIPGYTTGDSEMRRQAMRLAGVEPKVIVPEVGGVPSAKLSYSAMRDYLPRSNRATEYLLSRGVSEEVMDRFGVGGNEEKVALPAYHHGDLMAVKYRTIDKRGYYSEKGSVRAVFGYDFVFGTTDPVLVVKGEIACLVCWTHGFKSCAPTAGEGHDAGEYAHILSFSRKVIVVGDNDDAGIKGAYKRAKAFNAEVRFPPATYKDIDEWLLAEPENARKEIKKWIE